MTPNDTPATAGRETALRNALEKIRRQADYAWRCGSDDPSLREHSLLDIARTAFAALAAAPTDARETVPLNPEQVVGLDTIRASMARRTRTR